MKKVLFILTAMALTGCYSNNCPVENKVTCNYYFYDSEGSLIKYNDAITVSVIKPGNKTVYIYRKLGENTVTSDKQRPDLVETGFAEKVETHRKDTTLVNQLKGKEFMNVQMSYFHDADTLLLSYASLSATDTLYIEHENYAHVDLPECGTYRFHYIKKARCSNAAIDHIEISNPIVNYDGAENIKIYFNGVVQ